MAFRRIGLTGNIGSGKSEVATLFRQSGIDVINLDDVGRRVSEELSVRDQIASIFGPTSVTQGKLNRRAIQEAIGSSEKKRLALEKLLHPLIWKAFETEAETLKKKGKPLVVCEAALIFEAQIDAHLDLVVVVTANETARRDRVGIRDGISADLFDKISKLQMAEIEKLKKATVIIDNSGGIEALRPQVASLVNRWKSLGYLG